MLARLASPLLVATFCLSACAGPREAPATAIAPVIPDTALANGARAGVCCLDTHHASRIFAADDRPRQA